MCVHHNILIEFTYEGEKGEREREFKKNVIIILAAHSCAIDARQMMYDLE